MQTHLGMAKEDKDKVMNVLNSVLADLHVLYIKYRNYHWNIVGPNFIALHELFENDYDAIAEQIDEIAERIKMMGGYANGSMTQFLETASLKEEQANVIPNQTKMIENLVSDHETMIQDLRDKVNLCGDLEDHVTEDMLIELMTMHTKQAWMLRSHLG